MRRLGSLALGFFVVATLIGIHSAWGAGAGGLGGGTKTGNKNNSGNKKQSFKAGSDKTYAWKSQSLDACQKAGKPIVLYIYDSDMKTSNNTAEFFEETLFTNDKVKDALKDYTYVMITKASGTWPAPMTALAENGAALFLMTCDGTVTGSWNKNNRPSVEVFVATALQTAAGNAAAQARLQQQKAAEAKAAEKKGGGPAGAGAPAGGGGDPVAEKKPEKAGAIPGLAGEEEKEKGKGGSKPADKKKADDE